MSDELGIIASPLEFLASVDSKTDIENIKKIIDKYGASEIVVGLPLKMDGSESLTTKKVIAFAEELKTSVNIPVNFWDERFTSKEAERLLISSDVSRRKRKGVTDSMAAQLILQGYLDSKKRQNANG